MRLSSKETKDSDGPDIRMEWSDIRTLIAKWEIPHSMKMDIEEQFSIPFQELPFVLRLYDVTDREIRGDGMDHYVDFLINQEAPQWVLYGVKEDRDYCVELGVRMIDGRFYSLIRSETVFSQIAS
ncbi:DUF4912 domain-containing protein [Microaerobacter geothermalis]|uniref:DUF4912 domain-containing protein n=1 Tax=Microaerobacter geothermalis TaxID=674972 RepID=UPI001F4820FA|nr:DUF4912 domain-containing protein [Microaerobacter geothermalis]MCF6093684.1 DUF4912 domain-containing protein [Microaerobacter geothermalis]